MEACAANNCADSVAEGYAVCEAHLVEWAHAAWRSASASLTLREHTYLVLPDTRDEDAIRTRLLQGN